MGVDSLIRGGLRRVPLGRRPKELSGGGVSWMRTPPGDLYLLVRAFPTSAASGAPRTYSRPTAHWWAAPTCAAGGHGSIAKCARYRDIVLMH